MANPSAKIIVDGHVDDLYALSVLFRQGTVPDIWVVSEIVGSKDGHFDRVRNAASRRTFVTGDRCLQLIENVSPEQAEWTACGIIAPLNGYAVLADSNFRPVRPVSATWECGATSGGFVFGRSAASEPTRLIAVDRHPSLRSFLPSRVEFMRENSLAANAAAVLATVPSWAAYYHLLEDIAGHLNTTLDALHKTGLARHQALQEFKKAANNRELGRHGVAKRNKMVPQDELMNLLEAREFVRSVVVGWFDLECGGELPRDRVDGPSLRFGLDDAED